MFWSVGWTEAATFWSAGWAAAVAWLVRFVAVLMAELAAALAWSRKAGRGFSGENGMGREGRTHGGVWFADLMRRTGHHGGVTRRLPLYTWASEAGP